VLNARLSHLLIKYSNTVLETLETYLSNNKIIR